MQETSSDLKLSTFSANWKPLYRIATKLAIVMLLLIPLHIIIFVVSPPPATVEGFYQLYNNNWILGLMSLDLLYIINNIIIVIIYLAIFILLVKENPTVCLIALVLGLIGIACYFPSNPAFEMLSLSAKYFQASASQQGYYISAGETLIAGYTGTSFDVYYILNSITLLMFSSVIIKSPQFNKTIGIWGLISGALMSIPSSAGRIGMIFSLLSLIPWVIFIILIIFKFRMLYRR